MEKTIKMKNIIVFESILDLLDEMTNEEAGLLFKGLNDFRNGKDVKFEDRYLQGLWKGILPNLNNMHTNYLNKVKNNAENGKKGGRPVKKETIIIEQPIIKEEVINTPIIKEEIKEIDDLIEVDDDNDYLKELIKPKNKPVEQPIKKKSSIDLDFYINNLETIQQ